MKKVRALELEHILLLLLKFHFEVILQHAGMSSMCSGFLPLHYAGLFTSLSSLLDVCWSSHLRKDQK